MTTPRAARDGVVRHPLTGRVEFESTDHGLARHVSETLDRHDPIDAAAVVMRMMYEVPPADRARMCWVMPSQVWRTLCAVPLPLFAEYRPTGFLAGKPVVIDETTEGLTVRIEVDA